MDYKLAKELKDAGFPQTSGDLLTHVNDEGVIDEVCMRPTLSELIEACGDKISLFGDKGSWSATGNNPQRGYGGGQSPDEAVARLWLALQKMKRG